MLCPNCGWQMNYNGVNYCKCNPKRSYIKVVSGTKVINMSNNYSTREATLIYEEAIASYCFQFTKGFNKSVIDIIKAGIPTNERTTTGPPERKWYFAEKYFNLVKLALDGAGFTIKIITKEDIEKLRQEQAKHQEEAKQYYMKPAGVSIDEELQKFYKLIVPPEICPIINFEQIKNWTKTEAVKAYRRAAMFYHPDRNPNAAKQMSELNSTWAVLKDAYYIK
jgi:DnaJ-like protein